MKKYKLVNNLDFGTVFIHTLLWIVAIIFTAGLAAPFFAYYFVKIMINTTEIHEIE